MDRVQWALMVAQVSFKGGGYYCGRCGLGPGDQCSGQEARTKWSQGQYWDGRLFCGCIFVSGGDK